MVFLIAQTMFVKRKFGQTVQSLLSMSLHMVLDCRRTRLGFVLWIRGPKPFSSQDVSQIIKEGEKMKGICCL